MKHLFFFVFVVLVIGAYVAYVYVIAPMPAPSASASAQVATASAAAASPASASVIPTLAGGKFVTMNGSPYQFAANAPLGSVQYFAIYYSAQWCPPCHAFSPLLVDWYTKFKPNHPNFELIFVSEDHDEAAMLSYMDEMLMPWPAVAFDHLAHDGNGTFRGSGIERFAGNGIPDLVFVDAGGNVLSDSYRAGSYVGPHAVVEDINRLIGGSTPVSLGSVSPKSSATKPFAASVHP